MPDAPDALPVVAVLEHIAEIVAAADMPVNADFQSGYAPDSEGVAANVRRCVDTGVAGLSIEDATGEPDRPLFEVPEAVERVRAARLAIDSSGADVLLTARAECFLVGRPDPLRESIRRLQAYAEAGADVLYAPGPRGRSDVRAIVESVHPKPVNVLVAADTGLRVADLAELGVRRINRLRPGAHRMGSVPGRCQGHRRRGQLRGARGRGAVRGAERDVPRGATSVGPRSPGRPLRCTGANMLAARAEAGPSRRPGAPFPCS